MANVSITYTITTSTFATCPSNSVALNGLEGKHSSLKTINSHESFSLEFFTTPNTLYFLANKSLKNFIFFVLSLPSTMAFLSNAPNNPKTKNVSDLQRQPEVFSTSHIPISIGERRVVSEPMTREWREAYDSQLLIPVKYFGHM